MVLDKDHYFYRSTQSVKFPDVYTKNVTLIKTEKS